MKKQLADFGSDDWVIRASSIPHFLTCPWSTVIKQLELVPEDTKRAADTGSLVHRAAETFGKGGTVQQSIAAMRKSFADGMFPAGDIDTATIHFDYYAADKRNDPKVYPCILQEERVSIRLKAAETDPTQKDIVIVGHLDMVVMVEGRPVLRDIKTGSAHSGWEMTSAYASQLAAYQLAASELLTLRTGQYTRIDTVQIVATADYLKKKQGPVFYTCNWGYPDIPLMLSGLVDVVSIIRRGRPWANPGSMCFFCPAKGLSNCIPLLERYKKSNG